MPSSFVDSFPPIVKLLLDVSPRTVLDVGPGWGKYGLACREYLDVACLEAIEVVPGRLFTQDAIYDAVHEGDVRDFDDPGFWRKFDVVLMIDIIEHIPLADGQNLLKRILDVGCMILVATPKIFTAQDHHDNPYEKHQSLWTWEDFADCRIVADRSTIDAIIFLLQG